MTKEDLIVRNRKFVLDVPNVVRTLPNDRIYDALVCCATSIGPTTGAACKEKSEADFINKLEITEEEADEANYFLDIIANVYRGKYREVLAGLLGEFNQLAASTQNLLQR